MLRQKNERNGLNPSFISRGQEILPLFCWPNLPGVLPGSSQQPAVRMAAGKPSFPRPDKPSGTGVLEEPKQSLGGISAFPSRSLATRGQKNQEARALTPPEAQAARDGRPPRKWPPKKPYPIVAREPEASQNQERPGGTHNPPVQGHRLKTDATRFAERRRS